MRLIFLLLAAVPTLQAQPSSLATTDDGRQLYFASDYKIFRITESGLELFAAQPADLAGYHDPYIQPRVYLPMVTGDGAVVGFTSDAYCPPFYACLAGPYTTGQLRGRMPASLGQGTLSLSRNGRWAVLTARDYGSIYPWPNSQLLDLESGTTVWIPFPVYAPVVVASDGTIAQPNHFGAGVWKPNEYLPLPLAPQGPGGPVGISDNSRVVVAFDWWETGSQRFVAIELKTGTKTTLDWPTDPKIFVSFHGISNDGTWVLSSRSDQPGRARIQNSGTAEFQEIRIPGDEAIREAVLSGYGNRAFFVTASRRILVVELAEGRATDVRILCECGG